MREPFGDPLEARPPERPRLGEILKPGELAENTLETRYQYVVMDGRTVLIEPETRRVVHIID